MVFYPTSIQCPLELTVFISLSTTTFLVHLQCRRPGYKPWVGKISWRREWQLTPVLLPGESHGQRSLVGYSAYDQKELDMTE